MTQNAKCWVSQEYWSLQLASITGLVWPNALPCLFALHITEKHAKGQHTAINLAGASVPKLVPDYYQFLSDSVVVVRFSLISTIYIIHVEGVRCNYGTMPPNCKQIKQWEIFLVIISLFRCCCCCCSCCVPMQSVSCQSVLSRSVNRIVAGVLRFVCVWVNEYLSVKNESERCSLNEMKHLPAHAF